MLYKVVLTFHSVDEILNCVDSTEIYWAVLSFGAVYYGVQDGSNFKSCVPIQMKATSCGVFYFAVQGGSNFWVLTYCPFLWFCSDKVVLTFKSLGGILSETVQMKSTE